MSELTELLQAQAADRAALPKWRQPYGGPNKWLIAFAKEAILLLAAHDAEIREAAKLEQFKADCRAECKACRVGTRPFKVGRKWLHGAPGQSWTLVPCGAVKICKAWAKSHPEPADGKGDK
ncbi:MAG: hypothetical protein ACRETM_13710 [Stenotrophobium sp.]